MWADALLGGEGGPVYIHRPLGFFFAAGFRLEDFFDGGDKSLSSSVELIRGREEDIGFDLADDLGSSSVSLSTIRALLNPFDMMKMNRLRSDLTLEDKWMG